MDKPFGLKFSRISVWTCWDLNWVLSIFFSVFFAISTESHLDINENLKWKDKEKIWFFWLKEFGLPEFLYSTIQLKEMELLRLPTTNNILENGCFLLEDKSYDNWPLICDSSRRSIDWLKIYHKDKQLHILKQFEMKSILETCLSEGQHLLLTDCNVNELMANKRIETVLRNKNRFLTSDRPFKLNLGNNEIECNPRFR
jgi:hypothetical protein